jgi:hypothetical protein
LTDSGFDNVVAVGLPEATEAFARGIGRVIGYDKTAVCVIEPEAVIVLVIDTRDGAMQTVVSHMLDSDDDLIRWLSAIFHRHDWQPECLVVVGSGGDLDALTARLDEVLSVPVVAPAEARLALARGAALASAQNAEFTDAGLGEEPRGDDVRHGLRRPLAHAGALTMLVAGVLTLVVSISLAVVLQLAPERHSTPAEHRQVANTSGTPPVVQAVAPPILAPAPEVPAPAVDTPLAPAPSAAPPDTPAVSAAQIDVPSEPPSSLPAADPAAPPPEQPSVLPPPQQPSVPPPPVAGVPEQRPGILTRIRERLHLGQNLAPAQPAPDQIPPAVPGPPDGQAPPP